MKAFRLRFGKGKRAGLSSLRLRQPIAASPKHRLLRFLDVSFLGLIQMIFPHLAERLFTMRADERSVEYPFALINIGPEKNLNILDVGCYTSTLALELAGLGHKAYGIDIGDYAFAHPNFSFMRADICLAPFKDDQFDVITAISTLEHVGLGRWDDPEYLNGDTKALNEMARVMKPSGKAIISVPFGRRRIVKKGDVSLHRVYDSLLLRNVLAVFLIEKVELFAKTNEVWLPIPEDEAEGLEVGQDVTCVAQVVARKAAKRQTK